MQEWPGKFATLLILPLLKSHTRASPPLNSPWRLASRGSMKYIQLPLRPEKSLAETEKLHSLPKTKTLSPNELIFTQVPHSSSSLYTLILTVLA